MSWYLRSPVPITTNWQPRCWIDLSIDGTGFFTVQLGSGQTGYTRVGDFAPDAQGRLRTAQGALVLPPITIPLTASEAAVNANGVVTAQVNGATQVLGHLQLARFPNPEALHDTGDGIYMPTVASGAAVLGGAGQNGMGQIVAGALEMSNVNASQQIDQRVVRTAHHAGRHGRAGQ